MLRNNPGNKITSSSLTPVESAKYAFSADLSLKCYLNDAKRFWEFVVFCDGRNKDEELVRRCVGHQLEVVRRVLVVTRNVESHHLLQELLSCWIEGKQSISVDVEKLALRGMRVPLSGHFRSRESSIKAKHII